MHIYWRVLEELKQLGESWTILDPALRRNYRHWMRKNASAIGLLNAQDSLKIAGVPWNN